MHLAMIANLVVELIYTLNDGLREAGYLLGLPAQGLDWWAWTGVGPDLSTRTRFA